MSHTGYMNEQQRQAAINAPKLVVRVIEGRGLKAADWGGTSDPFVELRIKGQTASVKTQVIKKTLTPFWNEELILHPTNPEYDHVAVKVYDWDSSTNNDLLGEMEIPVALLMTKKGEEEWKQVMDRKGPTTFHPGKGEIKFGFTYYANGSLHTTETPTPAPAQVKVIVQAPAPVQVAPVQVPVQVAPQPVQYQQYPPQQYPPQQYPPQQYPPQQYPPQQYPPQQYPPQQYPPQQYPPQQYPPQQYPPQQYPPQQYPPQQYPPQQYPPQQYPPQPYPQYPPQPYGQYPPPA